jgi:ATP-dependent Clp protease ATP-binding subunit ClpC
MFERYTDECKRAIFLAQQTALHSGATAIDSNHLLVGLLITKDARANDIFRLQELLPDAMPKTAFTRQGIIKKTIPLSNDGKRVVAFTADEANRLRDYWIDTEHVVLGILREESNSAAAKLRAVGLGLESCRQQVVNNKHSRPQTSDPVLWWLRQYPITLTEVLVILFTLGIATALILLGFVAIGMAFALLAMLYFLVAMAREGSSR